MRSSCCSTPTPTPNPTLHPNPPNPKALPGQPNGFYAVAACSVGLGVVWLHCMQGRARALQARPREDWLASEAKDE